MSRGARFMWVGAAGFVVQAAALQGLVSLAGVPYPVATVLAVEAAILHNFLWHERWTWADRCTAKGGLKARGYKERVARLLRFNGATALISIAGNVALMALFVERAGLPFLAANLLSVVTLSALNFLAADRVVFSPAPHPQVPPAPWPSAPATATHLTHRRRDPTSM